MTSVRRFTCDDLFTFNNVNLDYFTETYNLPFYLQYLANWPEYCLMAECAGRQSMGYILGKVEGEEFDWHGHVTAVTVAPEYRRQGLAKQLMDHLESVTERDEGYFVDLFVRESNVNAINMYKKMGYSVYRTVVGYYSGQEDALDMRKAMSRDVHKRSLKARKDRIHPDELETD